MGLRPAPFGMLPDGRPVELYTLANASGLEVSFLALGGIIHSVKVPDRRGVLADVAPGYDSVAEYLADTHFYGALIGRYANRIAGGRFVLDGRTYAVTTNDGPHHLHGGHSGFHRALWQVAPFTSDAGSGAELTFTSPAGDEGFPGSLEVRVTYLLTDHGELHFDYAATTDQATPVSLTQHCYFNLAGHAAGDVLGHELAIRASRYLPVDDALIPTGELRPVDGTPFDLRAPRTIGDATRSRDGEPPFDGYDHSFVLDCPAGERSAPYMAARLYEPHSGRVLEIETTEPALQLYSGRELGRGESGKDGSQYGPHSAVALETQHFPNAPNEPRFPSTILRPGDRYRSHTTYRFGTD